ncbi:class I SAM-dependent DNA methyltransferase [Cerasicoccus fimbriatus]|uniref:class I SAM-dependent DNA methyltransferase n=1 Tax=Cerasicoccus fimbriatus TaxID=3014554 RepID=UPI0022B4E79D|nr:class I SAM-dependent methyltransferase [Cerasicoccus sp. TK19100]
MKPISLDAYEKIAASYDARAKTKPHNAYYDRPAVLSLLPKLEGKRVLDAGCGPGIYLEEILALGAIDPVGIDVSPTMLDYAKTRLGSKAVLHELNLENGIPIFEDGIFDVIICALVLDHIRNWEAIFREFFRVLAKGGILVFSVEHPSSDYRIRSGENYFSVKKTELEWRGFDEPVVVTSYRRPLQEMINPLIRAGFDLDEVLEPTPTDEFRKHDEAEYNHLSNSPGFLCFRAIKR